MNTSNEILESLSVPSNRLRIGSTVKFNSGSANGVCNITRVIDSQEELKVRIKEVKSGHTKVLEY